MFQPSSYTVGTRVHRSHSGISPVTWKDVLGIHRRAKPAGRQCQFPGCPTVLSIHNGHSRFCFSHQEAIAMQTFDVIALLKSKEAKKANKEALWEIIRDFSWLEATAPHIQSVLKKTFPVLFRRFTKRVLADRRKHD